MFVLTIAVRALVILDFWPDRSLDVTPVCSEGRVHQGDCRP